MLATPDMLAQHGETALARSAAEPGPFQDIPRSIWRIFLSAWATLFAMFILFFAVNAAAAFVVTIASSGRMHGGARLHWDRIPVRERVRRDQG